MVWVMHTDHTCEHMSTRNSRPQFCPTLSKHFFHMSVMRSAVIVLSHTTSNFSFLRQTIYYTAVVRFCRQHQKQRCNTTCRKSIHFWSVRKWFYNCCLWKFLVMFWTEFSDWILKDNHYKTHYGLVRNECSSYRVQLHKFLRFGK